MVITIALLWGAGTWFAFQLQEPTPEERYAEWLATRNPPARAGYFERLALRLGISSYPKAGLRADLEFTRALLMEDEYALAVASWVDSESTLAPEELNTWLSLRNALGKQLQKNDAKGLNQILARTDAAGFAEWRFAIIKSAVNNGASKELDDLIQNLRDFEVRLELGSKMSDGLERCALLYELSEADLGRVILGAEGRPAASEAQEVAKARGVTVESAVSALWGEWRSEGLTQKDWGLALEPSRYLGITSRRDYLVWLSLDTGSQAWRSAHRAEFLNFLETMSRSDLSFGREFASNMFSEMANEPSVLANDWEEISGTLLAWVEKESDLSVWVNDAAGPDFIWICHRLDSERLLDRGVRKWIRLIDHPHRWIAEFIEEGHYGAVCAVIEGTGKDIGYIGGRLRPEPVNHQEPPGRVDAARELAEKVASHSPHQQVKGFIELLVGERVLGRVPDGEEKEEARALVFGAISRLNGSETINPALLPQVVNLLCRMGPDFFEFGTPCFDRWRDGRTLDDVASAIQMGIWEPDGNEREIWGSIAARHSRLVESPQLLRILEEIIASGESDEHSNSPIRRFCEFLAADWNVGNEGSSELALVLWVAKKMIADGRPEQSAEWMFVQIQEYLKRYPDEDESRILKGLYDELSHELRLAPVDQSIKWLEVVLDERVSRNLSWPVFPYQIHDYQKYITADDFPNVIQESFGAHPLRTWIAHEMLQMAMLGGSIEEQRESLIRMREMKSAELWLRSVIDMRLEKTIDFDQFEKDMSSASVGAKRYFLDRMVSRVGESYSRVRSLPWKLSEENGVQLWLWMGEQTLAVFERGQELSASEVNTVFEGLLSVAEHREADLRFRAIFDRLHAMALGPLRHGAGQAGWEALVDWRERTKAIAGGGISEIENLLTNDELPTTERVWGLVVNGCGEDARKLMLKRGDDLTFQSIPRLGPASFSANRVSVFPALLVEEPELQLYAELYLRFNRSPSLVQPTRTGRKPWPASAHYIAKLEEPIADYARRFEVTEFKNKELEKRVFYALRSVHGLGPLMRKKVAALKASITGSDGISEEVGLANLEIRLADCECEDYRDFLPELESISRSDSAIPEGLETMRYHLWRKAVFNDPFFPCEREFLGILAFEEHPSRAMLHSLHTYRSSLSESGSVMKMQVVHFALQLAETKPDSESAWRWEDFPMASDERYQINVSDSADFTGRLAAVLAARCQDWDEESRWRLMELLQMELPGFQRKMDNRTITTFLDSGFVNVEGGMERLRDFVRRYPQNGWSYQAVIAFGQDIGDDSLVKFGWEGVEPFVAGNPKLATILERTRLREGNSRPVP